MEFKEGRKIEAKTDLYARYDDLNILSESMVSKGRKEHIVMAVRSAIQEFECQTGSHPTSMFLSYHMNSYARDAVSDISGKYISSDDGYVIDGVKVRADCLLKDTQASLNFFDEDDCISRSFTGRLKDVVREVISDDESSN